MGNYTDLSSGISSGSHGSAMTVNISGKVLTAAVIFLFLVVIFAILLFLYAKNNWFPSIHGRAHFIITTATDAPIPSRGLGADVLRSLPLTVFQRSDFKDGIECSVCLCEISEGEKVRLLPKCNHGFHLDCIDMWLHSHFTCPLCRCPVGPAAAAAGEAPPGGQPSSESSALPTNVLFWGNNGRLNTRGVSVHSARSLVITIPNRFAGGFPLLISPLGSNRCSGENMKSPAKVVRSPAAGTSKFGSLRRVLSKGKGIGGSSCSSPVEGDIEQGLVRCAAADVEGSSNLPKTPIGP